MADAEVSLKFSADGSEAEAQMQRLRDMLTELQGITSATDRNLAALQETASKAAAEVLEIRAKLNALNAGSPMAQNWGESMGDAGTLDAQADRYASQFAQIGRSLEAVDRQFVSGKRSLQDYESALLDLTRTARENANGIAQLQQQVRATNEQLSSNGSIGQVAGMYAQLSQTVQELGQRNAEMGNSFAQTVETLLAQASACDTATTAGQQQAQALQEAARGAQTYADKAGEIAAKLTELQAKMDEATGGDGAGKQYDEAAQKLDEYAAKLEEVSQIVQQNAQAEVEAGAAKSQAAQQSAVATNAESEAEKRAALQMEYCAMSRKQLIDALRKLIQVRQEAALAGASEAVAEYTQRISVARANLETMNQSLALMRVQLLQKAQLGLQAANSLQILGQQAASGAMDFGSMANAAMSFGYALKVGLGPVGWALAAIQGIGSAISWWNKVSDENRQKVEESNKSYRDLVANLKAANQEAYNKARKKYAEDELKSVEESIQARTDLANKEREANDAYAERRRKERSEEIEEQRKIAQEQFANAQALAQTRMALGDKTAQQELDQERERHDRRMSDLDEEKAKADVTYAEDKLRNANEQARMLREAANTKFDNVLSFNTSGMQKELDQLDKAIDLMNQRPDIDGKREEAVLRRNAILDEAKKIVEALQAIDPNIQLGSRQAIAFVEALRNSRYNAQNLAGELERLKIPDLQREVNGARENMAKVKEQTARKAIALASEAVKLEGNYRQEDTRTQQEIVQTDMRRLNAKKQQLEKILATLDANSQEAQLVRDSLATLKAQRKAIRDTTERREREKGWEEAREGSLQEQQRYVKRMLASVKQGTEEWETWAKESKKLSNDAASEELERIRSMGKNLGSTENLAAQKSILLQQQRELRALAQRTGLSASMQQDIRSELAEVQKAAVEWRTNLKKSAEEAQERLLNMVAPKGQALNKGMQGNLNMLEKAWPQLAARLEKAARERNGKEVQRLLAMLRTNAKNAERLTGNTGAYADKYSEVYKGASALFAAKDRRTRAQKQVAEVDRRLSHPEGSMPPQVARQRQQQREQQEQLKMPQVDMTPTNEAAKQAAQALQQVNEQNQQLSESMQGVAANAQKMVATYNSLVKTMESCRRMLDKLGTKT